MSQHDSSGASDLDALTPPQAQARLSADPALQHWRVLLGSLAARWRTEGLSQGAEFAGRVATLADELDHHPDIDLRYRTVTVTTVSHDVRRLTRRDRRLAIAVSALADELGLTPAPAELSVLEIGVDVLEEPSVRPFWRAVLGYEAEGGTGSGLVDGAGRGPAVWFQQMDEPRPGRNRLHLDVTVPHDVAEQRLALALAAGGRLVSDEHAPAWWVLADAEGNEVCLCTWQARG